MKRATSYTLFETVAGICGIAWSSRGIIKLQLAKGSKRETEKAMRDFGPAPATKNLPKEIKQAIAKVQRYLKGKKVDFSSTPIHVECTEFQRRIYEAARKIPYGKTASYGEVARMAGSLGAARAVGQAMSNCDLPVIIPCHRVVASGRKVSGSATGMSHREKLLLLEGVRVRNTIKLDPHLGEIDVKTVLRTLSASDPHLGKSIRATGEFLLTQKREGSPFQALARAIIYQQLATKAAASIFAKLKRVLEDDLSPQAVLSADDDLLRMAGLSRSKMLSLRDLAARIQDGTIPSLRALQRMSDEEVIERLTAVRGIGVWTAQMFLMFSLLRPNVLPATDYGVQKGFQIVYGKRSLPKPHHIEKHAARWHPYKSVASWYLWRATDKPAKAKA